MLIRYGSTDFVVQLRICQGLNCLKTLIWKCWPFFEEKSVRVKEKDQCNLHQVPGSVRRRVMRHRKVHIQQPNLHHPHKTRISFLQMQSKGSRTKSGWAWITCAILSRVNVSSLNLLLISFKTSACAGSFSSKMFLSWRYAGPNRLQKCCANTQPQSVNSEQCH